MSAMKRATKVGDMAAIERKLEEVTSLTVIFFYRTRKVYRLSKKEIRASMSFEFHIPISVSCCETGFKILLTKVMEH